MWSLWVACNNTAEGDAPNHDSQMLNTLINVVTHFYCDQFTKMLCDYAYNVFIRVKSWPQDVFLHPTVSRSLPWCTTEAEKYMCLTLHSYTLNFISPLKSSKGSPLVYSYVIIIEAYMQLSIFVLEFRVDSWLLWKKASYIYAAVFSLAFYFYVSLPLLLFCLPAVKFKCLMHRLYL